MSTSAMEPLSLCGSPCGGRGAPCQGRAVPCHRLAEPLPRAPVHKISILVGGNCLQFGSCEQNCSPSSTQLGEGRQRHRWRLAVFFFFSPKPPREGASAPAQGHPSCPRVVETWAWGLAAPGEAAGLCFRGQTTAKSCFFSVVRAEDKGVGD